MATEFGFIIGKSIEQAIAIFSRYTRIYSSFKNKKKYVTVYLGLIQCFPTKKNTKCNSEPDGS